VTDPKVEAQRVFDARGLLGDPAGIARHQYGCRVRRKKLSAATGGLAGLCIPLSDKHPDRAKGIRYSIVYDDGGQHTKDFIVSHELGHIVSNTFGRLTPSHRQEAREAWCDKFAAELVRLFATIP
jgi:hypothetical protein